ncbi:MAG: hypothetical protein JXA99_13560 [Candidatus Lokiarchaeota archaeon]|nr:hypothetical protein [Candidatus Lokiarchaeota archaeon]
MIELFLWIGLFVGGYLVIYFSADLFIDNLKEICYISGISPFIIGLIVVGIDPEESIASFTASLNDLSYIAVGNVIGNSIFSLSLCFALPMFFYKINLKTISNYYFWILYLSMGIMLLSFILNYGLFIMGLIALIVYFVYLIKNLRYAKKGEKSDIFDIENILEEIVDIREQKSVSKIKKIFLTIFGLIFIVLGGELLILSTEQIITLTKISETFFGLIIIAFITSVEELTLIFKSIKKKIYEIGLGGMIGKIIWNVSFTFGISGIIALSIKYTFILIINWFILLSLILFFHVKIRRKNNFGKKDAIILIIVLIFFIFINIYILLK